MHKIIVSLVAFLGIALAVFLGITFVDNTPKLPLVVISQIVQHDALDRERDGVIAALKDAGYEDGKTVTILQGNAQGNISISTQIANAFASKGPDVAVGISTPSAQSLIQPMTKHNVPIVFAAVTDPVEARLVSGLKTHPENITGVSDGLPLGPALELIQRLLPSVKSIGVIYNPGEANSAKAVEKLKLLAQGLGLTIVEATTSNTSGTLSAAASLIGRVEAVFIPNDNTAMTSIDALVVFGRTHNLPFFTPDFDSVERGVLAVRASSHFAMGYKAGQLVVKILKGAKASELPVESQHDLQLAINMPTAKALGIEIPSDLIKEAKLVEPTSAK
jgi:putative tryptophan/tyrosine transport system substrate-binding protein